MSDIFLRFFDVTAHYSDKGVLPRETLFQLFNSTPIFSTFSLNILGGSPSFQAIIFLLALFFAFLTLVGYQTRFATIGLWIFLISIHVRNPLITQQGDILLRVLLFWGMLVPWGAYYSLDSVLASSEKKIKNLFSFGSAGLLLQAAYIFLFSGLIKLQPGDWVSGEALHFVLHTDQFVKPFGLFLRDFTSFLPLLSYSIMFFQIFGAIFLFMPVFTAFFRSIAILGFWFMALGFGISLRLGPFPWVAASAVIPFIPSSILDVVEKKIKTFYTDKKHFITVNNEILLNPPFPKEEVVSSLRKGRRGGILSSSIKKFSTPLILC